MTSRPIDIPTRETVAFLASHLRPGASVLEIGCGLGHVGSELQRLGHRVVGIDADAEVVDRANARGFAAIRAAWPEFEDGRFDAVAFTRSLHHISALEPAIEKVRDVLVPEGLLLIEDFAFDAVERSALEWLGSTVRSERARSLIDPREGELVSVLLATSDVEPVWRERHARFDLHSMPAMLDAVSRRFEVKSTRNVPYLYRYFVPVLPESREAAELVEDVFREESRLAKIAAFAPIGRRIMATPRA